MGGAKNRSVGFLYCGSLSEAYEGEMVSDWEGEAIHTSRFIRSIPLIGRGTMDQDTGTGEADYAHGMGRVGELCRCSRTGKRMMAGVR